MTRPLRFLAKGRQVSALSTRKASQARRTPGTIEASVPPLMIASTVPLRIMWKAMPIA